MTVNTERTPLLGEAQAHARAAAKKVRARASTLWSEFRVFCLRGNVANITIAVIFGAAFARVVDSVVTDLFTPFIALATQHVSLQDAAVVLRSGKSGATSYPTLEQARADGAITWNWGKFATIFIFFLIICVFLFIIFRFVVSLYNEKEPNPETHQACPACLEDHKIGARYCPHCKWDIAKKMSPEAMV